MRCASDKCAIETIEMRGLPVEVRSNRETSSGSPRAQSVAAGDASSALTATASAARFFLG
jgi:hypothetical protein